MPTNVNSAVSPSIQPAGRTAETKTDRIVINKDGGSSSAFAKQTDVKFTNSVDNMSAVLDKVASSRLGTEAVLPKQLQEMINNVVRSAFSLENSLGEGLGSAMASERYSAEQLTILGRIFQQLGNMAEANAVSDSQTSGVQLGSSVMAGELTEALQLVMANMKNIIGEGSLSGNTGDLELVQLDKLAFQLLNSGSTEGVPEDLARLLQQLSGQPVPLGQPGMSSAAAAQGSENTGILKQLIDVLFPKPLSGNNAGTATGSAAGGNTSLGSFAGGIMNGTNSGVAENGNAFYGQVQTPANNAQGSQPGAVNNGVQVQMPTNNAQGSQPGVVNNGGQVQLPVNNVQGSQPSAVNNGAQVQLPVNNVQGSQPSAVNNGAQVQLPVNNAQGSQPGAVNNGAQVQLPTNTAQGSQPNAVNNGVQAKTPTNTAQVSQPNAVNNGVQAQTPTNTAQGSQPNAVNNGVQAQTPTNTAQGSQPGAVNNGAQAQMATNTAQGSQPGVVNNGVQAQLPTNTAQGSQPNVVNNGVQAQLPTNTAQGSQPNVVNNGVQAQLPTNTAQGNQPGVVNNGSQVQLPVNNVQGSQPGAVNNGGQVQLPVNNVQGNQPGVVNNGSQVQLSVNNVQGNQPGAVNNGVQVQMPVNNVQGSQPNAVNNGVQVQMPTNTVQGSQPNVVNNSGQMPMPANTAQGGQLGAVNNGGQVQMPTNTAQGSQPDVMNTGGQPAVRADNVQDFPQVLRDGSRQPGSGQNMAHARSRAAEVENNPLFRQIFSRYGYTQETGIIKNSVQQTQQPQPHLANNQQTAAAFKDMAQLMLKDSSLTAKDTQLLQNFVNGSREALSQQDARQLNLLLRMVQGNIPAAVQQAGQQPGMEGLPKLWAFLQLAELGTLKNVRARDLKNASREIKTVLSSLKGAVSSEGSYRADGQKSISFVMPLYIGENEQSYPAYINLYHEPPHEDEMGRLRKDTWFRVCVLTENIGAVDIVCQLYEGNNLNLRIRFSDQEAVQSFSEYLPDIRKALYDTSVHLNDLKVGTVN